jgi:hypothetical protein
MSHISLPRPTTALALMSISNIKKKDHLFVYWENNDKFYFFVGFGFVCYNSLAPSVRKVVGSLTKY